MKVSYLEEYCDKILSGEIYSELKIQQICSRLKHDIHNPGRWHFDEKEALRHINFIEKFCKTPSGKIGVPLKLQLFQKAILEAAFGFVDDDGIRQYNEVFMVCGRKNGKTSLLSAIMLDMLVNDGEGSPQCVTASTSLDQSKLSFNAAWKMVQQSPALSKHIRKRAADLYYPGNFGTLRALADNSNALDGLDIHCCVCDEQAAWKKRDVFDLLKQSMGSRRNPILFTITTNNFIRGGIFDSNYDYATEILEGRADNPRFLPFIYELKSAEDFDNPDKWIAANPGLGSIKSFEYLEEMVQRAKDDVSFKPTVLVKDFNLKQTGSSSWLRWEDFDNSEKIPEYAFRYGIGGFDAADTTDLNAAKVVCMKPDDPHVYVKSMYWLPSRVIDEYQDQGRLQGRDNVPYALWRDLGYLRTVDSHKVDKKVILEWFKEIVKDDDIYIRYIGYDPWHIDDSLLREFKYEFGEASMIPIRQGVATLSQPMKELKSDLQNGLIIYDNNPIDKWCFANTAIKTDVNANIQPVKTDDPRKRIDGTMALIDAYVVLQDKKDEYLTLI